MLGLVVMEGLTLSGHPSIINKIESFFTNHPKMAYPDHRFVHKVVSVLKTWMFFGALV